MKSAIVLSTLILFFVVGCRKEEEEDPVNTIPPGSVPFTDSDIMFNPYTSQSINFINQNDELLTLNFIERKRTEEYYAWDQTYFTFSTDVTLELEMRLRYLQSDVSKKTLALYMPYYDNSNVLRQNLFELPIDNTGLEDGFFKNLIEFHDTLMLNGNERYSVYEAIELVSTDEEKDSPTNFSKIFYNREYGILQMNQKNGVNWVKQ